MPLGRRRARNSAARAALRACYPTAVSTVDGSSLLEAMPDAVVVADMQSRIVYANAAVERLLGWKADELVGKSLHVIQPERLHPAHDAGFSRYAATGATTLFGTPVRVPARHADGTEIDIELNLSEIHEPSGRRLAVGVLRDLTERVELERQLSILRYLRATSAATARMRSGLDSMHVLRAMTDALVDDFGAVLARTWVHDPVTNSLHLRTSGGLSTEVAGSSRERIDVATYPYKVGAVARTRQPFIRNGLVGDEDFDQDWVVAQGIQSVVCYPLLSGAELLGVMVAFFRHPIPDEVAETIGHLASLATSAVRDANLVAQERAARALADRASRHFELLARVSERLTSSLDEEVTVRTVAESVIPEFADWCVIDLLTEGGELNAAAVVHRDPEKAALVHELRLGYPPASGGAAPHPIRRAMDGSVTVWETVRDEDLQARAADPRHLSLLRDLGIGSHIVVPVAARGRVIGAISVIRGHDRPAFDADDVATAQDIARGTALATDNARLYRSAQQAVAVRDRFLAVASHELRTPLSVAHGHFQLLSRRLARAPALASEEREKVETSMRRLGQGLEQLRRLVQDLLDIDRIGRSSVDLQRTELDLVALVKDVLAGFQELDGPTRIHADLPGAPVVGVWDADRLAQVIGNVVHNALKYSPSDRPVEVALTATPTDIRIRVTDLGIGIAADQLNAVFEPFIRAPNASSDHFPGMGLGLAISRELVDQMRGQIWAESAGEGRGTSFLISLPRDAEEPAAR